MKPTKPRILLFIGGYLPGYKYGGSLRTIEAIVEKLHDDFEFLIVTLDRDLGDSAPYPGIQTTTWYKVGNAQVYYLPPQELTSIRALRSHIQACEFDIAYLNSYFHKTTIIYMVLHRLHLIPKKTIIVATRGEFSPKALLQKAYKKKPYIKLAKLLGLYEKVTWQTSTGQEKNDLKKIYPQANIQVASDMASIRIVPINEGNLRQKKVKEGKVVFVSRISPIKNLKFAIKLLFNVQGCVEFDIIGPAEDTEYWEQCQQLIGDLPDNVTVNYLGPIAHDQIMSTLQQYHLFLLPTLGENFGHVILEALVAGCLALISDQTPWRNLQSDGIGWALPLDDVNAFEQALQQMINMDDETFQKQSQTARKFGKKHINDESTIEANRQLFWQALKNG